MRAIELLTSNGPVKEDRLRAFELSIGGELPDDYRVWMLECNGGFPGRNNNFIDRDRFRPPLRCSLGLEWFLSIDEIAEVRMRYGRRIPSELIPIAEDGDGNVVCVALFGEFRGAIYFWDHEVEPAALGLLGESSFIDNVRKIAVDFSEFLEELDKEPGYPGGRGIEA